MPIFNFNKLFRLLSIFASFPCQGLNDLSKELFTLQWSSLQVFTSVVLVLCFLVRWIFVFLKKYLTCYSPNLYLMLAAMTVPFCGFFISPVSGSQNVGLPACPHSNTALMSLFQGTRMWDYPRVPAPTLLSSLDCRQLIYFIFSFFESCFPYSSYIW